jgi:hypothetical protein
MSGRDRNAQPTGEDDEQGGDEILGESLAMIEACNFLAHGDSYFSGIEQTTHSHSAGDGQHPQADSQAFYYQ